MIAAGKYPGKVLEAWVEQKSETDTDLVLCVSVDLQLPDGTAQDCVCRHPIMGPYGDLGRKVGEKIGVTEWPGGLRDLSGVGGADVDVAVKHTTKGEKTYVNYYILVERPKRPASKTQIEMGIAKIEAGSASDGDDLPF